MYDNRNNHRKPLNARAPPASDESSFEDFLLRRTPAICSKHPTISDSERANLFNFQKMASGINLDNFSKIPIEVRPSTPSVPTAPLAESFSDLGLLPVLASNLSLCGYEDTTPVQKAALPLGLAGNDLLTCAQTGSGKTAAFLVPLIQACLAQRENSAPRRARNFIMTPQAIILAPTRELAKQVYVQAVRLCHGTDVFPGLVYGGSSRHQQLRNLRRGCDILVGTPGRVNDFISAQEITLEHSFGMVLDEGDKMLDMGFMEQIQNIERNGKFPKKGTPGRQIFLFSATFPDEIRGLANDFLDAKKTSFITVGVIGANNADVKQHFVKCDSEPQKRSELMEVLEKFEDKVLVFVAKKRTADDLEMMLRREKIRCAAIHGDKSQDARDHVLSSFKSGRINVLVATDVAARGLDIPSVQAVVNFDLANNADDHVHRIGRTGRCGNTGEAFTFVGENENKSLYEVVRQLKKDGAELPEFMERLAFQSRGRSATRGGRRGGRGGGYGGGYSRGGGGSRFGGGSGFNRSRY